MARERIVEIYVDEALCKGTDGCGICMHVCPKAVYDKSGRLTPKGIRPPEPARIGDCTACNRCMIFCPDLAIVVEAKNSEPAAE